MELLPGIVQIKSALECKRIRRAKRILSQVLLEYPNDPDLAYMDGLASYFLNDFESARSRWEYALILSPSHKGARRGLERIQSPSTDAFQLEDDDLDVNLHANKPGFNPFRIFLKPKKFFSEDVVYSRPAVVFILILLSGLATGGLRVRKLLLRFIGERIEPNDVPIPFHVDWFVYVCWIVPLSLFIGVTVYVLYGFIFRVFLRICGAKSPDLYLTRRVVMYTTVLTTAMGLILQIVFLFFKQNPPEQVARSIALLWVGICLFSLLAGWIWSVYVLYRASRCCFAVKKWRLRFLLFVLPCVVIVGIVVDDSLTELTYAPETPNVETLRVARQDQYSVDYPNNWLLTVDEYDDSIVTIEPGFDDAYITFTTYHEPIDVKEIAVEELGYLGIGEEYIGLNPFQKWGNYTGFGYFMDFEEDGVTYKIEVFAATGKNAGFSVIQVCEESIENQMHPGLIRIQDSFVFKDVQSATPVE